jgi:hypothetical protein
MIGKDGEVYLSSTDTQVIDTADHAADHPETFFYWTGKEQEQVTGTVISSFRDGGELHFSVRPEIPGAHAI